MALAGARGVDVVLVKCGDLDDISLVAAEVPSGANYLVRME